MRKNLRGGEDLSYSSASRVVFVIDASVPRLSGITCDLYVPDLDSLDAPLFPASLVLPF